ncbi:MAG: chemotaxis response regulator protein-glutamate methylesterase [Alphaproteobacteria bacterium]|nr:MAG: chemotaxis response regulator protein-glutamate methylesterase [Alphaproteobacteria bacterium]
MKKIGLLIIDDSRLIRSMIRSIVSADPLIEVIGEAADPFEAREKIKQLNPDVVTLDVEMPKMDGLSFLEKIMSLRPMPVVMVSTLTQKGADVTLRALELGAVDYVAKPLDQDLTVLGHELILKIKIASSARIRQSGRRRPVDRSCELIASPGLYAKKLIVIGSSTGGVESLYDIIVKLPVDCPPVIIAQHISQGFSGRFAVRINKSCSINVKEAEHGEKLLAGMVYIGQGGKHITVKKSGHNLICQIAEDREGESYRPSVDRLFCSVAEVVGAGAVGVILTGMGKDGALGLLAMRGSGAVTLGQDEASSIVYGMPKAAMMAGAVEKQVPLSRMAREIIQSCAIPAVSRKVAAV